MKRRTPLIFVATCLRVCGNLGLNPGGGFFDAVSCVSSAKGVRASSNSLGEEVANGCGVSGRSIEISVLFWGQKVFNLEAEWFRLNWLPRFFVYSFPKAWEIGMPVAGRRTEFSAWSETASSMLRSRNTV
jgi:hypothetical protein